MNAKKIISDLRNEFRIAKELEAMRASYEGRKSPTNFSLILDFIKSKLSPADNDPGPSNY